MRILFDHSTPAPLRHALTTHVVVEAVERGWDTLGNRALLDAAQAEGFEIFVTADKNIRSQQNLAGRRIAVVILGNAQWPVLRRQAGRGDKLALRWIGRDDEIRDFSYAALRAQTNRFANVLAQRGITKGDRVYLLLGRSPELYIAALGTLKNASVLSPLFSAFGPEPAKVRMMIGNAKALVTSEAFYRRKIEPWREELASLAHVFLTDYSANPPSGTIDLSAALAQAHDVAVYGLMRDIKRSRRQAVEQCPRLRPSKMLGVISIFLKIGANIVLRTLSDSLPLPGRPWAYSQCRIGAGIDRPLTWVNSAELHIAGRKIGASIRPRLAARTGLPEQSPKRGPSRST
jgi:hypothetical protein